jgi:hypothetical protein
VEVEAQVTTVEAQVTTVESAQPRATRTIALNSDDEASAQESEEDGESEEGSGEDQVESDEGSDEDQGADEERDDTWEIEGVVSKRYRGGVLQYQVKWLGFDTSENTWEPKSEIPPEVVKEYEAERRKSFRYLSSVM